MKNIEEKIKNTINSFYEECIKTGQEECGYRVRNGWVMTLGFCRGRVAVILAHEWCKPFKVGVVPPPYNHVPTTEKDWRNIDDIVRDVNDITERRGHDAMWGAAQFALRMGGKMN